MLISAVALAAANLVCTEALLRVVHRVLSTALVAAIVAQRKRDMGMGRCFPTNQNCS